MKKLITGKVRDVYEVDEQKLVIVTTDRLSAFDVVLSSQIPRKGVALNTISNFWFDYTKDIIPNHIVSTALSDMPSAFAQEASCYENRTILAKKLTMLPYEIVVRGYIFGNMWEAYKRGELFCGEIIEGDYKQAQKLREPIITPSAKNHEGHDEYITITAMKETIGAELTTQIMETSVMLYSRCYEYALQRGIIIADTKFEFGIDEDGSLVLADEIFTPDSSRFWDASTYKEGISPKSYDKQFVRDWLIENQLDGVVPAPSLPVEIVEKTAQLYQQCMKKIVGIEKLETLANIVLTEKESIQFKSEIDEILHFADGLSKLE